MSDRTEEKGTDRLPLKLLNEGPEVIGCIATVLEGGGSLDTAVREIADSGPPCSAALFKRIADDCDLRVESDVTAALSRLISDLPEGCTAYGLALRMAVTASDTKDRYERSRILKEAADISLNGLSEAGKTFASSLNMPCMLVFGMGIMVPMVLMSILPMMSLSGLFGASSMDLRAIAAVTLVLIPCGVLAMVSGISRRNPVASSVEKGSPLELLPFLLALPLAVLIMTFTGDTVVSICVSAVLAGVFVIATGYRGDRAAAGRGKAERELGHILLEVGNRLITGAPFETSVTEALERRKGLRDMVPLFRSEMALCRGDVESAIRNVFLPVSTEISGSLVKVYRASLKDLGEAGRLAVSLGRRLNDRASIRRTIRNELKGMCDTMYGTAAVFAPLVLGLSVSMLEPLKHLSETVDTGTTSVILSVYLCELCGIIALLLAFVEGGFTYRAVARRAAGMCTVSLTVFLVTLGISL